MPGPAITALLRASPVFGGLPAREIDTLAAAAVEPAHDAREYVFMEGDPARWLCVVRSGHVKILRQSRDGGDVILELLGPGEIFGGVAVLERRPYPASAQAAEPATVVRIPAEAMIAAAERHPSIVREMAQVIARRLRAAHDAVASLAADPAEARLAAALLRLVEREGQPDAGGLTLPFPLTRQSLADMTGTTVETAIRIIGRWTRDGLVADTAGRLVVRDLDGLRRRATGAGS